jgi:hypothetical protein
VAPKYTFCCYWHRGVKEARVKKFVLALFLVPAISFAQSVQLSLHNSFRKIQSKVAAAEKIPRENSNLTKRGSQFEIVRSGAGGRTGDLVSCSNGVEILYRGYRCLSDTADGDLKTQIFRFSGNVRVIGQDSEIVGESVTVNFKSKTFNSSYSKASIRPSLVANQVTETIFLSGKQTFGDSKKIEGVDCIFTTCDNEHSHYHLDSESSQIEPGKQAILRKVKIRVLGKKIVTLPILWIPLGDRSFKNLPQFGQTPDEGYFVKNRYGFLLKGDSRAVLRTDYMSKLGVGLGLDTYYRSKDLNGIAKVYTILGENNTTNISSQHEQRLGFAQLTTDIDYQNNNYLSAPSSTLLTTRGLLRLTGGTTNIGFSKTSQNSANYANSNQVFTFSNARQIKKGSSNLDVSFNSTDSTGGTSRQTIDLRYRGQLDLKQAVASLEYQRTIPVGEVTNFFSGSDRTPVVSLTTDSQRLYGAKSSPTIGFRTDISIGEYLDPVAQRRISRGNFDTTFNRQIKDKGNWKLDLTGGYRQGLYSDNTAQYRITYGTNITYSISNKLTSSLRYSYLKPFGYSPLVIDRTGNTNQFSYDVSYKSNSKSSFGLQTGYDIERTDRGEVPWQQVGIRSEYKNTNDFSFRTLTSYDTFQQVWSNFRLDAQWVKKGFISSLSARYDGIRGTWAAANLYLDGLEFGKMRIGSVLNFNGYSGRLDSQQYNLVYSLHCFEAVLTVSDFGNGFRSGREVGFFIRLKAIPFDGNFGFGRRGQGLGSGTGRDF